MSKPVVLRFLSDDKQLDQTFRRIQAQAAKTNGVLASMGKFSKGMTQVGKGLSQYITLPVAAAGFAAVKLATDFQTSMTHIRTLVGASSVQVAAWSKQILELAPKVGKSPKELADALYFITSSGIAASRAMNVLTFSAKASAAGLGATQVVADTVTSAMNAYGQKVLSAKNATDVLLATVRDGKAEPEELARSIGRVVSPAALLGVTFRQVGAATAAMTDTGLDAFTSTTALRQIFVTLLKPAAQTEKQMGKLGLSAAGLRTELREKGLLATMETLHEKGSKNVAVFGKLFPNVRALNGFLAMMGPNAKQTSRIFADLAKDGNDTNKAFEIAAQTSGVKFHQALASLAVVGIEIGNDILPAVTRFATKVAELAQKFDDLSPHTRKMIEEWALVAAAVGPTVFLLGKIGMGLTAIARHPIITILALLATEFIHLYATSESFRNSVNAIAAVLASAAKSVYAHRTAIIALTASFAAFFTVLKAMEALTAFIALIRGFVGVAAIASSAIKAMRGAMLLLNIVMYANPIGIVVAALAALGVGFYLAWHNSQTFRDIVRGVWQDLKAATGDFGGFFLQVIKFIVDAWFAYAGLFVHAADKAFGWIPGIGPKLHGAVKAFDGFHNTMDGKLTQWSNDMYGMGEDGGSNLGKGISAGIAASYKTHVLTSVTKMADGTIKRATTRFEIASPSKVFERIGQWVGKGLAQGISKSTIGVLNIVNDQTKKLQAAYDDQLAKVREAAQHIEDVTQGHWAGKGKKRHWVGPTPNALHGAQNRLANAQDSAADAKKALEAAQNAIINLDLRREAGAPLLGLAAKLTEGITDALGHAQGPIESIAERLSATIKRQFADSSGAVPAAVQAAIDNMSELAQKAGEFRTSFIEQMKGSGDLAGLISTDDTGNPVPITGGSIKAFLGGQLAKLKTFATDLGILGRKGLPGDFLMQIANAGLDNGLPVAEALVNSSQADFQEILALQAQFNELATRTGDMAQSSIFSGGLRGQSVTGTVPLGTTDSKQVVINVSAQTDADPNDIANEIAWALKTAGA